jgi:hypothetical protein
VSRRASLDQDRADAAGAADDQERLPGAAVLRHPEPVEQQLVGGDRGQRQGGGLRVVQALRRERRDALVHHMQFAVGPGPGDRARVVHAVARLEALDRRADGLDRAARVPAQHLRVGRPGPRALAHLGVDRVHGDRLHPHQQVARARRGVGQVEILERRGVVDGKGLAIADGFHGVSLRNGIDRIECRHHRSV